MKDESNAHSGAHSSSHAALMSVRMEENQANTQHQAEEGQEPPAPPETATGGAVIGELLKPEATAAISRALATAMIRMEERHSGPLPSPKQLRLYEECQPGLAERIVSMAEREQAHRHKTIDSMESLRKSTLSHVSSRDARGQYLGAGLALSVLTFCFYLAASGSPKVGGWVAVATMVGLAGVFVTRRIKNQSESEAPEETVPDAPSKQAHPSNDEKN